ncbi:MAG: sulfatase [Deltaproteobacteria bacterium]|nr:sulfatase [Deltaproteobacteria bacterium]
MRWNLVIIVVLTFLLGVVGRLVLRPTRLNVVLITIDTQRADRLGCYGYAKAKTPNLDTFASEGVRFTNAFCDVTWTTPSMASVMTGQYAAHHGMRSTYQQLNPSLQTLAEILKKQGYHTAAVIGSFPLDSVFGLDQGFDEYDDRFTEPIVTGGDVIEHQEVPSTFSQNVDEQRLFQFLKAQGDAYRPDDQVSDAAIQWLNNRRRGPFFLWVHYFGPHELADTRLSFGEQNKRIIDGYDGDVERTDHEVGRFLNAIDQAGLRRETLVIIHADHGQSLGEHDYVGHGRRVYDPTMHIPLLMRAPGRVPSDRVVNDLVRNIDILPTILDLTGIAPARQVDGSSMRPTWEADRGKSPPREAYVETYLSATDAFAEPVSIPGQPDARVGIRRRGVRTLQWKLVVIEPWQLLDYSSPPPIPPEAEAQVGRVKLFNLIDNPEEDDERLVVDHPEVVASLRAKIEALAGAQGAAEQRRDLSDADKERLRGLGYMH